MVSAEKRSIYQRDVDTYELSIIFPAGKLVSAVLRHGVSLETLNGILGVDDGEVAGEWSERTWFLRKEQELRLRCMARVAFLLHKSSQPELPETWLSSPSPYLSDQTPGELIRTGQFETVIEAVKVYLQHDT